MKQFYKRNIILIAPPQISYSVAEDKKKVAQSHRERDKVPRALTVVVAYLRCSKYLWRILLPLKRKKHDFLLYAGSICRGSISLLWSGILYRLGSSYITLSVPQIGILETIFDVVNTIRVLFDLGFFWQKFCQPASTLIC